MRRSAISFRFSYLATSLLAAALASAAAQDFTGTYTLQVDQGVITVELAMAGQTFRGYLQGPGVYLQLEGELDEDGGVGMATSADAPPLGFLAAIEGDTLGLWFYEIVDGVVVAESEIEMILQRVGQGTALGQPLGAAQGTPPPAPGGAQPSPPAQAPAATGGMSRKQLPGTMGGAGPGGGPAGAIGAQQVAPAPQSGSPVIATGQFGSLTQDDAMAFIEALEFVLEQIGYAYTFTEAERAQAFQALAQNYPMLAQQDQLVLSQARDVWERVRANWAVSSPDEQREFAIGVLVLAFGEETVAQWAGTGGGSGGGACTTFEDCTSSLVGGEGWSDTMNAQGCWAAAGCNSYDPSTNSFDYDGY